MMPSRQPVPGGAAVGVSATEPDWKRERPRRFWDPSRRLLRALRRYQAVRGPFARLRRRRWALSHRFWSVITQADIPLTCKIGGGLSLPHPNGVVIHPRAVIGPNCQIFQQVTVGAVYGRLPVIGGHVDMGAGAKILGAVTVGDHAVIGANAVVTRDVPENRVVGGIPARILERG